jgi:sarcosine oxidase subunit beta
VTDKTEVVVVGAGIIGSAIAFQLARRRIRVIALDKAPGPGEGSTGASSSICRAKYSNPEVVRLASHGLAAFGDWREFTGLAEPRSGLQKVGVLWIMGDDRERVESDVARMTSQNVDVETLDARDVSDAWPALSTCSVPFDMTGTIEHVCAPGEAYLFESGGGYADPVGANQDLVEAARVRGASVRFSSRVVAVETASGKAQGVSLADGETIHADLVINAAGPWCNQLNELAGIDLRWTLTPTRIQTVYRPWPVELGTLPIGIDATTGTYFRPESAGAQVMIGGVMPEDEEEIVDDPDSFKAVPDAEFTQMKLAAFHHRVPSLEAKGDVSGVAGLYTINREDVHPILGPTELDGFWVANGFSGHGFKLAPAIGSMVAQAISGSRIESDTDVPMDFFSSDRKPIDVAVKNVLA